MSTKILIADDDEVSCQLFAETLESEGFHVDQVTSGDAALARLAEDSHDLLIIDVRMPGISGLEVTRVVHEKYPVLPVIVMTAFGSMETAVEAIHEGAFDFISKPMNLVELKKTVSRALAQRSLQRRAEKSTDAEGENPTELGKIILAACFVTDLNDSQLTSPPRRARRTRRNLPFLGRFDPLCPL